MVEKVAKIWMDGELVNWDDAKVHVLTHSLHYGLGAFEGIRAYRRADGATTVFRLREHIDRLLDSCGFETLRRKFFSLRDNPAGLATSLAPALDPMARHLPEERG